MHDPRCYHKIANLRCRKCGAIIAVITRNLPVHGFLLPSQVHPNCPGPGEETCGEIVSVSDELIEGTTEFIVFGESVNREQFLDALEHLQPIAYD